jgi:MscS family membrane protein
MNDIYHTIMNYQVAGITAGQLILSFLILFLTLLLRRVVVHIVVKKIEERAAATTNKWDDEVIAAIRPPLNALILTYGIWLAIQTLPQPTEPLNIEAAVDVIGQMLILILISWGVWRLLSVVDEILKSKATDPTHWLEISFVPLIGMALRILVLITSGIVIAQNLGYSVSGLVASLGLGGAALALASKDTVANLFGSVMIVIDKPFTVGDWIKGNGFEGVVEEIGFRSTRIRTFDKTVENIPNNVLANVKVENMDRRKDEGLNVRKVSMTVGVTYSVNAETMERITSQIKEILKADEGVDQRMTQLVRFTDFGASSLDIFLYYFSNSADWDYYLSVRERVNLKIMRLLESLGASIAFPSRSLYIESLPEQIIGIKGKESGKERADS